MKKNEHDKSSLREAKHRSISSVVVCSDPRRRKADKVECFAKPESSAARAWSLQIFLRAVHYFEAKRWLIQTLAQAEGGSSGYSMEERPSDLGFSVSRAPMGPICHSLNSVFAVFDSLSALRMFWAGGDVLVGGLKAP